MSMRTAAETAERCLAGIHAKRDFFLTMYRDYPAVRSYITAHVQTALQADPAPLAAVGEPVGELGREIKIVAADAAVGRLWERSRIVYDVDPRLWAELGDTDPLDVIPRTLFTRLRHPDPFIMLPEPLVLPVDGGKLRQRIVGFFVRGEKPIPDGKAGRRIQASTHADGVTALGLLAAGFVEDLNGVPLPPKHGLEDILWTRITLDPAVGEGTIADMLAAVQERFSAGGLIGDWRSEIRKIAVRAVSLMVYVCAANGDLADARSARPPRAPKGKSGARPQARPKVVEVGYRVGAALEAVRQQGPAGDSQQERTSKAGGWTVRGHVRRAHFHTFAAGPGRTERVVHWLPPIPINLGEGPAAQVPTVIPVGRTQ